MTCAQAASLQLASRQLSRAPRRGERARAPLRRCARALTHSLTHPAASATACAQVWKLAHSQPYPQVRMARLMEVSASAISRYIHGQLSSLDLWTTPYPKVERFLTYGLRVCR